MPERTPPVTAGHEPVARAVREYAARQPSLVPVTSAWVELVTSLLDDAGINYLSVTGRTKTVASFAGKAARSGPDGTPLYADPAAQITDAIGVRVITYVHRDVDAVADLLAEEFAILDDRDLGAETAQLGGFGYASRHLLIAPPPERELAPAYALLGRGEDAHHASVQVRTVLQHAWAEFEHDIRYKGTIPEEHSADFDRRFTLAAGLLELADREFSAIREQLERSVPQHRAVDESGDPRIAAKELSSFLSAHYTDAGWSRSDHYGWISGLLLELGITSLDELGALLASVDSAALHERMGYRHPAGAVRKLDDALLAIFGDRYATLHGNAHRTPLLRARLARIEA
ncbi:GTP pyrophosphokinase [Nocardioides jiangxiensis]|uniref:(P)ppGpp synthetase n=1 Tax=Nocardioides jiangxiensis TaxID=3064524 RepID=A0ABT9AYG7_9ACTN|nr:(p)ppGpp synthetase [Nocardioides sp. WY-20]MDO7867621.1 (p)ppGpp synthetase [Nocardioides sp. WY-20]